MRAVRSDQDGEAGRIRSFLGNGLIVTVGGWFIQSKLNEKLNRLTSEHSIRFGQLHDRRATVIEALYEKIVVTENAFRLATSQVRLKGEAEPAASANTAWQQFEDLRYYFAVKKLYLSDRLKDDLGRLVDKFIGAGTSLAIFHDPMAGDHRAKFFEDAQKAIFEDAPGLLKAIELEMKDMLGVKEVETKP